MADLPWIDEKKLAKEHPMLFHYTTKAALPDILKSRGLFATHYGATNDSAEVRTVSRPLGLRMVEAGFPRVVALAKERKLKLAKPEPELKKEMLWDAGIYFNAMLKTMPTPPHITCFSAHDRPHQKENGLLTMWRLYGASKDGGMPDEGVALGFNTEKLRVETEKILERYGAAYIYLDRVRYGEDDPEIQRRVTDSPSLAALYAQHVIDKLTGTQPDPHLTIEDMNKFTVLVPSAKHLDFEDEREIRLVVSKELDQSLNGRIALSGPKDRLVIRYMDALEAIMVGPSKRQDALFNSVSDTLRAHGFEHISVLRSRTPFRFL